MTLLAYRSQNTSPGRSHISSHTSRNHLLSLYVPQSARYHLLLPCISMIFSFRSMQESSQDSILEIVEVSGPR